MSSSEQNSDSYENVVDEAIAMCGGDLRGAVRALLIANEHLEGELSRLRDVLDFPMTADVAGRGYLN